jgi:hypothetical protein
MNVKATITLNQKNINTLIQAAQEAHKQATQAMADDILASQVVPKDTGKLESTMAVDTSAVASGETAITFHTVYSRRLYFNPQFNFHQDKNANAQGMWMQSYIDGGKAEFVKNEFSKAFKDNAKGVIK